jgi:molybdate transport system ATP-binding protein
MGRAATRYLEVQLGNVTLRRAARHVLRGISWRIRPGERWVLAGANGAGKTQLLKLIAGAVWPTPAARSTRHYRLRGELHATPYEVRDEIAYVGAERQDKYQRYGWNMRAAQVIGTGLYRSDIPLERLSAAERRAVSRTLTRLRAAALARRPFLSLSYGERRVILVARALIAQPRLLLLDEVLNGLDGINRRRLMRWLSRARGALPWVLATHRLEDVPAATTHALILERGRIVYAGTVRRAPLVRYLEAAAPRVARKAPRAVRPAGSPLVRLARARVYLEQRRVLDRISLTVRRGEFWVIHGRNGSGKTTLLRTLYGDHGVAVGGVVERAGVAAGVPLESFRRRAGLVAPHLHAEHPQQLTVTQVVQSGRHASIGLNARPSAADRAAARTALRAFGLTRLARRPLGELSYGQSRRALFARALVRAPRLLLLDEPFAGLDARTRRELAQRVAALSAEGTTVIVSAHSVRDWRACATHEVELAGGRARYCGPLRAAAESRDAR